MKKNSASKSRKSPSASKPRQETVTTNAKQRRAKALILGALSAGGVFQMGTWQVQAHGNRSSHTATKFQQAYFSPDDYMVMRQSLSAPDAAVTNELMQLTSSLTKAQKSQNLSASDQTVKMQERKTAIETELRAQSDSMRALRFVQQGDAMGAVASIEGQGEVDKVLTGYIWALLDVAYLNGQNVAVVSGQANIAHFESIAKPAMAYADKTLSALPKTNLSATDNSNKVKCGEVYHNIASFLMLQDHPSNAQISMALTAAQRSLQIRQDLKQAPETMRAFWMLGTVYIKAKQNTAAEKALRTALQQAAGLHDQAGVAWAKYSLSMAIQNSNSSEAATLRADAQRIANSLAGKDVTMDFLRLEIESHGA